jgi:hypothetical protein
VVLTFCVHFWWIRTWPNGWWVIFPTVMPLYR